MNWRAATDWPHRDASRFVTMGRLRWHVQQAGEGDDILLLHGTGASTHSWRHIFAPLAETHRVTAIDLPGQGFTLAANHDRCGLREMAEDITALLAEIAVTPRLIIGHSAGAAIAFQLALDLPTPPTRVVSINGALEPFHGLAGLIFPLSAKLISVGAIGATLVSATMSSESSIRRLIESTGSRIEPEGLAQYRRLVADTPHVDATIAMMARWELDPLLARMESVPARATFLVGEKDRAVTPRTSRRWAEKLEGATLITEPTSGHLLHEEDSGAPFLKHLDAVLA